MTKVLAVSDTHGRNDRWRELIQQLQPDIVLHAGDHCTTKDVMNELATFWVAGNNDYLGDEIVVLQIEQVKFVLLHGHQASRINPPKWRKQLVAIAKQNEATALIYGHSHIEHVETIDGVFTLNPGSLELPRNNLFRPTYATFSVDQQQITNVQLHFYGS